MTRLLILGAGGHGRVVADAAEAAGVWSEVAFLDDRCANLARSGAWPVLGAIRDLSRLSAVDDVLVCAIGAAAVRTTLQRTLEREGHKFANVLHPRSTLSKYVTLGAGVVVFAGACVNTGATLGNAVIVNTGATVDHDCELAEGVHVCPGAHLAGDVKVGRDSWIGIGASVRQGIVIGAAAIIGAGAAVVGDVPDAAVVTGVPARVKASSRC